MIVSPEMVKEIVEDVKKNIAPIKSAQGPLAIFKAVAEAVPHIINRVESVTAILKAKGVDFKSVDKKELALDLLFALVKLPVWLPRFVAEPIAGHLIDYAVAAVNKYRKG